jgi:hypothetical protein
MDALCLVCVSIIEYIVFNMESILRLEAYYSKILNKERIIFERRDVQVDYILGCLE